MTILRNFFAQNAEFFRRCHHLLDRASADRPLNRPVFCANFTQISSVFDVFRSAPQAAGQIAQEGLTARRIWSILASIESGSSGRGAIPHRRYSPRAERHDLVKLQGRQYSLDGRRSCDRRDGFLRPWTFALECVHSGAFLLSWMEAVPLFHDALNRWFRASFFRRR